ncbi:MAG TPA: hypothetical protein VG692_18735 [Gemmatimonadales bacterium]|nr:hypothetical protein [Gemmatimonadales bacterium]
MNLTSTTLPLTGFGTSPSQATVEIGSLTAGERLRRAAIAPALGMFVSVAVLPIPIVHFAVPPVAILTGIAVGIRRVTQRRIITRAEGTCPFCGTRQTLGLNGSSYHMPRELKCRSCLKPFTISAD